MNKRRPLLLALVPLAALVLVPFLLSQSTAPAPAAADADVTPGRYIVVLESDVNSRAEATALGAEVGFETDVVYSHALMGFAANMSAEDAEELRDDPDVVSVEPDRIVRASLHTNNFQTIPTGVDRIDAETQPAASVGGTAGPDVNIDVAVIDTGIDTEHFELNVSGGVQFVGSSCAGSSFDDDNGHGTHVAGTIAAQDDGLGAVGVAPGARLWAVKVLDAGGSGFDSCVIDGVDWVAGRRAEFNDGAGDGDPGINIAVANMSLGGGNSPALCTAIASAVTTGVIFAVAAGNGAAPANNSSPANCPSAITVSAFADFDGLPGGLDDQTVPVTFCNEVEDDSFACFSNYGSVVDIVAPGVEIISTYPGEFGDPPSPSGVYSFLSGTSMATPHVAGAIALFKVATGYNGSAQASNVMNALNSAEWTRPQNSTCGFDGDPDGTPEPMLFLGTGCAGGSSPTPTPAPTPSANDRDGDGVGNLTDNCPDWFNPAQQLPSWPVPAGDNDCDGFNVSREAYVGTDGARACAVDSTPGNEPADAWPVDNDDNRVVNLVDVIRMGPSYLAATGSPNFDPRFDINASGRVDLSDVVGFGLYINRAC